MITEPIRTKPGDISIVIYWAKAICIQHAEEIFWNNHPEKEDFPEKEVFFFSGSSCEFVLVVTNEQDSFVYFAPFH